MTTSLRLLLEDYLSLMREEGELDVFLPLLMAAMGHEVVYRPQKGTRQYGVDVASIGIDADGKKKLFMWLIKCGDIGRPDWDTGPQAIRQSMNDVSDVYVHSYVAPSHKNLDRKLLIVTNGDFLANINQSIATYLSAWSEQHKVETEQVNGSKLASWTEEYLLNEYVLPSKERGLLRRMLANVQSPELCIAVGRQLIDQILNVAVPTGKSGKAIAKLHSTSLRGVATALNVLFVWGQNEGNLLGPYRVAEYAVLAAWSRYHSELSASAAGKRIGQDLGGILAQVASISEAYHAKLDTHYHVQDAFAYSFHASELVSQAVFEEIGRLGAVGYFWAHSSVVTSSSFSPVMAVHYADRIEALLASHSCSEMPVFDHHSVHIHAALLLLLAVNRKEVAKEWLNKMCHRMAYAFVNPVYFPTRAQFEDIVQIRHGYMDFEESQLSASTLTPILLTWFAALEMPEAFAFLRGKILETRERTTPNFWSSDVGYDEVVNNDFKLYSHGVGEAVTEIPVDPLEFLTKMSAPLPGCAAIADSAWYKQGLTVIPLLAAIHWHLQMPREAIVQQAAALCGVQIPIHTVTTSKQAAH